MFADADSAGHQHFTIYCNQEEFCTLEFGGSLFVRVAEFVLAQRTSGETYPIYISDLDLSTRFRVQSGIDNLRPIHLLNYKKRIEYQLTRALRSQMADVATIDAGFVKTSKSKPVPVIAPASMAPATGLAKINCSRIAPVDAEEHMSKADKFFARADGLVERLERLLPRPEQDLSDSGIAWRWRSSNGAKRLHAINRFNPIHLCDLRHVDAQKAAMERNTRQFLAGLPANNALLWGPRGTGKSSLIKALLNDYADAGMRLIEVDRMDLVDLPDIVDRLEGRSGRFVIYCDDLSFDANDATYRALKSVLDGSVLDTPDNIIIYATSNRRHLMPEHSCDNLTAEIIDGELHQAEAVEEKISLSERFGLWLSFHPLNQEKYLDIVQHWVGSFGIEDVSTPEIREAALKWALLHGSRSGRSAYQFAKDWAGRTALEANDG